jgi:hypothetical protein
MISALETLQSAQPMLDFAMRLMAVLHIFMAHFGCRSKETNRLVWAIMLFGLSGGFA